MKIMKKITWALGTFLTLFLIACEGPQGPPGYDGRDGLDGEDGSAFEAQAFEVTLNLTLNSDLNRYESAYRSFPNNIEKLQRDMILIYRLEEVVDNIDVWRQLPQPFITIEGTLYYNFDFAEGDYRLYVEPEFDASFVPSDLVQNQTFRIVVVPTDFGASAKFDKSNIGNVMQMLGITEKDVQKIKLN